MGNQSFNPVWQTFLSAVPKAPYQPRRDYSDPKLQQEWQCLHCRQRIYVNHYGRAIQMLNRHRLLGCGSLVYQRLSPAHWDDRL